MIIEVASGCGVYRVGTYSTLKPPHSPRVLDVEAREARPRRGDGVVRQPPG